MVKISYGEIDIDELDVFVFEYEWDRWDTTLNAKYEYADWRNLYLASMNNDGTLSEHSPIEFKFSSMFETIPKENPFILNRCYSLDRETGEETDYNVNDTTETYKIGKNDWTYVRHPGVTSFRDGFLRGFVEYNINGTFLPSADIRNYNVSNYDTIEREFNTEVYNIILAYQSELSDYDDTFTEYIDAIKNTDPNRFDVDDPTLITYPISTLIEGDEVELVFSYNLTDSKTIYCVIRFTLKDSEN